MIGPQQGVTPICIIKRSQSLPNDSETTDRAADLEDFLSSRSGVTDLSTDKQEDDEEDEWKDASPITPVYSPTKISAPLPSVLEIDDVSSNSESKMPPRPPDLVAAKVTSPLGKIDVSRDTTGLEKNVETVAPKVKLKEEPSEDVEKKIDTTTKEVTERKSESIVAGPPISSIQKLSPRRPSLKRHSSLDSDTKPSLAQETSDRSEASSEKGARRKVSGATDDTVKRKSRKKGEHTSRKERTRIDSTKSTESIEESDKGRERSEPDELQARLKADRKSLKEQECIERVTEFLRRHSLDLGHPGLLANEPEITISGRPWPDVERTERPSPTYELEEEICTCNRIFSRPAEITSPRKFDVEREGILDDLEEDARSSSIKETPSTPMSVKEFVTSTKQPMKSTSAESTREFLLDVTRDDLPAGNKRPSSLKKKKKEERSSRESSKESLLDETKKEVRIQEDVQEIFFEDASEAIAALLPEVQLVKARIITAEEAAANRFEETKIEVYESFEVKSPPEVAIVLNKEEQTNTSPTILSPKIIDKSQLQLPALAKSTSENALAGKSDVEEAKVSQRNLKPEILLDLSKMSSSTEEVSAAVDATPEGIERRSLTRTGSEGSKRSSKAIDQRSFGIKRLAQPAEPELTTLDESRPCEDRGKNVSTSERNGEDGKIQDSLPTVLRHEVENAKASEEGRKRPATLKKVPPVDESPDPTPKGILDDIRLGSPRLPVCREELSGRDSFGGSPRAADYERVSCSVRQFQPEESRLLVRREEDSLIGKEHSLQYQSQTLETQSDHFGFSSSSLDNLILVGSKSDDWTLPEVSPEHSLLKTERSFQQASYSTDEPRRERRDVETQTQQESKSTQCSPEQSTASQADEITAKCPLHVCQGFYQSPRKEVQTQTQGESKSVQCSLEELVEELGIPSKSVVLVDASSESPARSLVQESKSIQCLPQDISPRLKSTNEREVFVDSYRNPRKEVEVQTYQESKGIQCSDEELLELAEEPIQFPQPRVLSLEPSRSKSLASTSRGGTPKTSPTVVFVKETVDMTVTHRDRDGNIAWTKHWGPERLVKIYREPKTSLGLSIVGGKVDLHNGESSTSQNISGIFIKNVLPNSPAGRTGELKIGDRIIEVDGVDLRQSTHERAVEVIQAAGNPVCLLVQSLVNLQSPENDSRAQDDESDRGSRRPRTPTASFRRKPAQSPTKSPDVMQKSAEEKQSSSRSDFRRQSTRGADGAGPSSRRASMKKSIRKKAPSPPANTEVLHEVSEERDEPRPRPVKKYSSEESSEEEDTRMLEGNVYTKAGMEISRKSAGNVKRSKEEIEADPEKEDEYGYTKRKVQKKYRSMGDSVLLVAIEKDRYGLGISLAGHKDRNRMAVFICGLNPKGSAYKAGTLSVGDEILEVNGTVLQGRCHLNASALIKGMAGTCFKIVVVRKSSGMNNLAVKPIVQFPPTIDEADQFSHYKGVHTVPVKKGTYGLGIMIIEGKHAEVGQGIFVSDIQEGSAAEQAGLQVGDLILSVNMDCLLGSTYDQATSLLKKAEGVVRLTVCNPNQSKIGIEGEGGKGTAAVEIEKTAAPKEPEKPKEPEPPQDPKDCKINVGKDTTIEFPKDKDKAIGFTIAGGSDTPMKGVFILEVFPDGAAGKDGRLEAGDQILDMCQESFKEIEHSKAHAAVLKATGTITMIVHRQENPCEEIEVELQKKSGKGAGLCFTGFKSGKGAYVSDLLPGGSALESGKICKGDRVVAVCGQDVREAPVEDIAFHVKVSNPVQLKLARYKSAKQ